METPQTLGFFGATDLPQMVKALEAQVARLKTQIFDAEAKLREYDRKVLWRDHDLNELKAEASQWKEIAQRNAGDVMALTQAEAHLNEEVARLTEGIAQLEYQNGHVCHTCWTQAYEPTPDGDRCLVGWQQEYIRVLLQREAEASVQGGE